MLNKSPDERKSYDGGRGYLIAVGATRGKRIFEGIELEARYFFDALDMSYEGALLLRSMEKKSDARDHPEALEQAFEFGRKAVTG
jgi:hypothetical protein